MIKNYLSAFFLPIVFFTGVVSTQALELDAEVRTVKLSPKGETVVLTLEQVKRGKRLFNNACAVCHIGGITRQNPNVGLDIAALKLSTPPKDNIANLVSYVKDPMTYDGLRSISEFHPSIKSAGIFKKVRSLTEEDLFAISGHVLLQSRVLGERWGGGKIYY